MEHKKPEKKNYLIIGILILAALLRFYGLERGDTLNDEVLLGFRAVGLMDYTEAANQTTPLQWFDKEGAPSWTKLSYHDHPPLIFLLQHASIKLFGETNFGLRFPSALFGVASVYLIYILGKKLWGKGAGNIAAAILAVTANHVFISRVGLQESILIFFMTLTLYWLLQAKEQKKYFLLTGIALGLALLTKFTGLILIPITLITIWFYDRPAFKNRYFWLGILVSIILVSPVILYNLKMYQATGHFDFQISYLLGQNPEVWPEAFGKLQAGSFKDRLVNFIPNLFSTNSWGFMSLVVLCGLFAFIKTVSGSNTISKKPNIILISFICLALFLLVIGPQLRFLAMLTPFFALSIGLLVWRVFERFNKKRNLLLGIFGALLISEIAFAVNTQIAWYPKGKHPWTFSFPLRYDNYNWGYNALGDYFDRELEGKTPKVTLPAPYNFIKKIQGQNLAKDEKKSKTPYPALIVYYGNFDRGARLWVLDRRFVYHAWPILDFEAYAERFKENLETGYRTAGFEKIYVIVSGLSVPEPAVQQVMKGLHEESIKNERGDEILKVYTN